MNITIVGLGYVGSVSAACFACDGHHVWGIDINPDKVKIINDGRAPVVEPGLDEKIAQAHNAGRLIASVTLEDGLAQSDLCFIAVATPSRSNGQVDPAHLFRACECIADSLVRLDRRQIIVVRSTVLPIVFRRCAEIFDEIAPGRATVCVNPEFLREGSAIRDFEDPPFTLLGVEDPSVESTLRSLYADLTAQLFVLPPREALLVKYASNAFHAMKVAFANEIGAFCAEQDIDADAVMSVFCSDTKLNIAKRYLMPGFAFGGSCLPKDVRALAYAAKSSDIEMPLIGSLLSSNQAVIERALGRISSLGVRRLGLIGLSFKPNTDDLRESPYVELAERLLGKGYSLKIYDPNVSIANLTGANKEYIARVIPHLARLLVPALDDLKECELLLMAHAFPGVEVFVQNATVPVVRLSGGGARVSVPKGSADEQ